MCMHASDVRLNKWHGPAVNHFKSSWTKNAVAKLMDLVDTPMKVNGPKNTVSKLMDLDDTPTKVNGPPVHFTLNLILQYIFTINM